MENRTKIIYLMLALANVGALVLLWISQKLPNNTMKASTVYLPKETVGLLCATMIFVASTMFMLMMVIIDKEK